MVSRRQFLSGVKTIFTLFGITAAAGLIWLQLSGGRMLSVQSSSMVPAIPKGSLVLVNSVPSREIAVGDVITYVSADKTSTITHRVSAKLEADPNGNKFVTKGDANAEADAPIEAASVVGRVDHNVPYVGYFIDFVKQPLGLILLIYIPALFIIVHETQRLSAYYRRIKPYVLNGYTHGLGKSSKRPLLVPVLAASMLGTLAFASGNALAAIQDGATLTGNTITINAPDENPEPEPPPPTDTTVKCTNTNNVDVESNTNQTAESGDAEVYGNTDGGSATSGNVSNNSSTSIDVNIDNTCQEETE